jgi:LAO/AO transport system kinase
VTASDLAARVRAGERRALAQAITLAESKRAEDRAEITPLLEALLPHAGGSHRVAVTGPPGAGKSSLVDALGAAALAAGRRVAVLAIDPASAISGGSVLGDAVRMQRLQASEQVFLRASSNRGELGGTAPATREAIWLCEAAGYDLVVIETVGVGQAEQAARELCDTLVMLALAGTGDEIQGMKRGLLEVADAILVNKADGEGQAAATAYASELQAALSLLRPNAPAYVAAVSAKTGQGITELQDWLSQRFARLGATGELARVREQQLRGAFRQALLRELEARVAEDSSRYGQQFLVLEQAILRGEKSPALAARELAELVTAR